MADYLLNMHIDIYACLLAMLSKSPKLLLACLLIIVSKLPIKYKHRIIMSSEDGTELVKEYLQLLMVCEIT